MSDFYSEKMVAARKEHKCYWCEGTINKGDFYYNTASVYQHVFSSRKECSICNSLVTGFCCSEYDDDDGITHEYLRDYWKAAKCTKCKNFDLEDNECNIDCRFMHVRCDDYVRED